MKTLFYNNRNAYKPSLIIGLIMALFIPTACEQFVEISPPKNEIVSATVFTNDASAASAVRGIYSLMMSDQSFTNGHLELYSGLSADEFVSYSTQKDPLEFYTNSLATNNPSVLGTFWKEAYKYINNANAILEGISNSSSLSFDTQKQLEGEARFIRAFCNFYLTNLFGDVPYIATTDYRINSKASRTTQELVYAKIIEDLLIAEDLLKDDFSFSGGERVQPNKGAATALLARVYLYTGNWAKAEEEASILIDNTNLYSLESDLTAVFLANSNETIWQLKPVVPESNTRQAQIFILNSVPSDLSLGAVSLRDEFISSFESNDKRFTDWVGVFMDASTAYYYPYKYKVYSSTSVTEYSMVFRLAEQYLIRAEARTQQGDILGAQEDLNAIRSRAGLENTTANDQPSLLLAIEQERKIEFFAEGGHRWLDLKRWDRADAVLAPLKSDWQETDVLYPIPESERLIDTQLSQNLGY